MKASTSRQPEPTSRGWLVMAAALGYLIDLYDIVIFGVVRVASLEALGVVGEANTLWGIRLFNLQMAGLLLGGFFWGWVADRFGRRRGLILECWGQSLDYAERRAPSV